MQQNKGAARALFAMTVAALLSSSLVGTARAAVSATAVISATDVAAGSTGSLSVEISNPSSGTLTKNPAINVVRVLPPISSAGSLTASLQAAADQAGWSKTRTADGKGFRFTATGASGPTGSLPGATGGGITDGSKQTFSFTVAYASPAADTVGTWRVLTSTDGGSTYTEANGPGSVLSQQVRVLAISGAVLDLKRPGFATSGQNNRKLTATISNTSSLPATVTVAASNPSGDTMAPVTVTVPPGGSTPVVGYPTFGSASSTTRGLVVTATGSTSGSGGGSVMGSTSTSAYTVQAPITFSCAGLTPAVVAGGALVRPKADLTASNAAGSVPSATLSSAASYLDFGSAVVGGTLPLVSDLTSSAGSKTTVVPFADGTSTAPASDLTVPVTLKAVGTDANGAVINQSVGCGSVTVDVTAAIATVSVSTPQRAAAAVGETPGATTGNYVAKNKDTVTFSGTVKSGSTPDGASVACTLLEYAGGDFVGQVDNVACTNNAGTFSAKPSFQFNPVADNARLRVVVTDAAGNVSTAYSPTFLVDTAPPVLDDETSKTVTPTRIVLKLSELVALSQQPTDFQVTTGGNPVLVESVATNGGDGKFSDTVTLTLRSPIGEDAMPTVTYMPAPTSAQADGAGNRLTGSVVVNDGIAPGAPTLLDVDGHTLTAGSYYTNHAQPSFRIKGVADQQRVSVYRDANANGHLDDGESALCAATNSAGLTEVLCNTGPTQVAGDQSLILVTRDPSGNATVDPAQARLVVDFTGPQIVGMEHISNGVVVILDERANGTDSPDNWFVARPDGETALPVSMSVDATGTRLTLVFSAGDASLYEPATSVSYHWTVGTRYADYAGNSMADQTYTTG